MPLIERWYGTTSSAGGQIRKSWVLRFRSTSIYEGICIIATAWKIFVGGAADYHSFPCACSVQHCLCFVSGLSDGSSATPSSARGEGPTDP